MQGHGPETRESAIRASLSRALTFHASFDHGPDADFALGDRRIYSVTDEGEQEAAALTPGLGQKPLAIAQGRGRFGAALELTLENSHVVIYRAARNVAYSPEAFRGTASLWMSLDPAEIPERYCDPFQLTDKDYSDACIWADFTKNDTPSDFRLGCFGDRSVWDVTNQAGRSEEFFFRLVKVAEPPFAKGRWTHVAITWDGLNTPQPGRARLYLNAEYRGATSAIPERFTWDVDRVNIRLGTGHYVGLFDDIAFFDRPLAAEEIRVLYGLESGVAELRER